MQYRINPKNNNKISALGYGAMRFPSKGKEIDVPEAIKLLRDAYNQGVNYFDTAYIYYDGKSEEIVGEAIKEFRKNVYLATKLPLMPIKKYQDFDRLFNTSLARLQTDYIDYYLVHCVLSYSQYAKMVDLGLNRWIEEKKESGAIRNIGFSFHGRREDFLKVIDSYAWDFVQIQYNYLDVGFQAGRIGLEYAYSLGIPVIIMEPLRGGDLVNKLPKEVEELFRSHNKDRTMADWGLRFVYNHLEVMTVLSGMGSQMMLDTNVLTASTATIDSLTQEEKTVFDKALTIMSKEDRIGCTGCGYCQPCPQGVDIPACFSAYNSIGLLGKSKARFGYMSTAGALADNAGFANQCNKCGLCEKKCPQNLEIRAELIKVRKALEFPGLKGALKVVRALKVRKKKAKL